MGFILWGSMGALGLGGALFFLPKGLLLYLNEKDNEKMISDLKTLYHAMEIQIGLSVGAAVCSRPRSGRGCP